MNKCIMSTDGTIWMPGQSHQCERRGFFSPPGELGEYLTGLVCKQHIRFLVKHREEYLEIFRRMKVPKGENMQLLQQNYLRQSVFSELSP